MQVETKNRSESLTKCSGIVQALCFILYSGGAKHGKHKYK